MVQKRQTIQRHVPRVPQLSSHSEVFNHILAGCERGGSGADVVGDGGGFEVLDEFPESEGFARVAEASFEGAEGGDGGAGGVLT